MRRCAGAGDFAPAVRWLAPSLSLPEDLAAVEGVAAVAIPLGVRGATVDDRFTRAAHGGHAGPPGPGDPGPRRGRHASPKSPGPGGIAVSTATCRAVPARPRPVFEPQRASRIELALAANSTETSEATPWRTRSSRLNGATHWPPSPASTMRCTIPVDRHGARELGKVTRAIREATPTRAGPPGGPRSACPRHDALRSHPAGTEPGDPGRQRPPARGPEGPRARPRAQAHSDTRPQQVVALLAAPAPRVRRGRTSSGPGCSRRC